VAAVLMLIVMIGVVSFSLMVKEIERSSSKISILKIQLVAATKHMTKTAENTVGNSIDVGIADDDSNIASPVISWISFRLDKRETPANPNDDTWASYMIDLGTSVDTIYYCERPFRAPPAAPNPNPLIGFNACALANSQMLLNNLFAHTINVSNSLVNISITNRYFPGEAPHELDNPEYTIDMKISPRFHTW